MISRLMRKDHWFENHSLSANFIFTESYMSISSSALPSLLQDEGPITRMSVSYDNMWISYLFGIEDIKRITDKHSTTFFRLNGPQSPYRNSHRLTDMMQLLPMGQIIQPAEEYYTSDYFDYLILVRNSDWAEPIKNSIY